MNPDHEHEWWGTFESRRVKVVNGVAVMPWGDEIRTDAKEVEYPVQTGRFACRHCGVPYRSDDPGRIESEPQISGAWPLPRP
jgi:hypothetical protein